MVRLGMRLFRKPGRPPSVNNYDLVREGKHQAPRIEKPNVDRYKRFIKHGPVKWRDFRSSFVDPPYWYKWSLRSPYSPQEQMKIRTSDKADKKWYRKNYMNFKVTEPDKWMFYVGDKVEVQTGKDKGKTGLVIQIVPERSWVVVGGLNLKYHDNDGEILGVEEPYFHEDLKLVDPKENVGTDVEYRVSEQGHRVRVSLISEQVIDFPPETLWDGTIKELYECQDKDTEDDDALKRTYVPSMTPWKEELEKLYNFNDPPRRKTYWY